MLEMHGTAQMHESRCSANALHCIVVRRKQEGEHLDWSWTLLPAPDAVPTFALFSLNHSFLLFLLFILFSLNKSSYYSYYSLPSRRTQRRKPWRKLASRLIFFAADISSCEHNKIPLLVLPINIGGTFVWSLAFSEEKEMRGIWSIASNNVEIFIWKSKTFDFKIFITITACVKHLMQRSNDSNWMTQKKILAEMTRCWSKWCIEARNPKVFCLWVTWY